MSEDTAKKRRAPARAFTALEDLPLPTAPTLAPAAGPSTCDAPFTPEAPHG